MNNNDASANLVEQVKEAASSQSPLHIVGGNSKAILGEQVERRTASELSTLNHSGVISYDPTELVVTVRAGTPIGELNNILTEAGQMMPFEPPALPESTIGGVIACGLSGPRRPFSGSARDYVLGTRVINGQGQDLAFGGEVMKNVAGYDVSRVQVGAWGTLGVLLDISMKVLPLPEAEVTVQQICEPHDLSAFAALSRQPLPLTGAMQIDGQRYLRFSGSQAAVSAATAAIGGETLPDNTIWNSVRDHSHSFFTQAQAASKDGSKSLWRIGVADYHPALELHGHWLYEWAGGQRWLLTDAPASKVFEVVAQAQGHASRYSAAQPNERSFQPLSGAMQTLQSRVRDSFDPLRLFNRGRFHPELDESSTRVAIGA